MLKTPGNSLTVPSYGRQQPRNGFEEFDAVPREASLPFPNASAAAVASPRVDDDAMAELRKTYCEEEIEEAASKIDGALEDLYPTHKGDVKELRNLSHNAVKTVKDFRDEMYRRTKQVLGAGDIEVLDPGDGPKALKEALDHVFQYAKARSCVAVEAVNFQAMMTNNRTGVNVSGAEGLEGKELNFFDLYTKLTDAVRLHVDSVVEATEVKLEAAAHCFLGQRGVHKYHAIALVARWLYKSILRVDGSISLGHPSMSSFKDRLEGKDMHVSTAERVRVIGDRQVGMEEDIGEIKADVKEAKAGFKELADRHSTMVKQIDQVLAELNEVRNCEANRRCPRGFFLVPANKEDWSLAKKVDSFFEAFTRSVDLFFVCRMFFEDLKDCRTEEEANDLLARRSSPNFEHEFAEPLTLELPKKRVADNLHIINLSVKILTIVVQAATLGLPVGNVIPKFNLAEQDELVEVARSHLVLAAERAAGGEPAENLNFRKMSARRLKKLLLRWRKQTPGANPSPPTFTEAHQALQGYLDHEHPGAWEDRVCARLTPTENKDRKEFAYICEKTVEHRQAWTGEP